LNCILYTLQCFQQIFFLFTKNEKSRMPFWKWNIHRVHTIFFIFFWLCSFSDTYFSLGAITTQENFFLCKFSIFFYKIKNQKIICQWIKNSMMNIYASSTPPSSMGEMKGFHLLKVESPWKLAKMGKDSWFSIPWSRSNPQSSFLKYLEIPQSRYIKTLDWGIFQIYSCSWFKRIDWYCNPSIEV